MLELLDSYTANTVDDVQSVVRTFAGSDHGLLPAGGSTRIHVGHTPSKPLSVLSTLGLNQIIEYRPEDLAVSAQAGVTLTEVQHHLNAHGQWLPIDVAKPSQQTLGGIVASRANSSLRPGFGSIRDWLIGIEIVNGSGDIVKGGGMVVKNVAGYDLPKLYCGSWGTLGVLTKLNFKAAPRPETDRSVLIVLSPDRNAEDLIDSILGRFNPASALLFNANAAKHILGPSSEMSQYLLVRFIGQNVDVSSQIDLLPEFAAAFASSIVALPTSLAEALIRMLTDFSTIDAPLSATYHILSSQVGAYIRMVDWIAQKHGLSAQIVADTSCGIVNAHFFPDGETVDWLAFLPNFLDKAQRVGGSLIIERMPECWIESGVQVWSPILDDFPLMKLIKQNLDPDNIFSPGRFIGGI